MNWEEMALLSGSYVDENLRQSQSDMLYRVPLRETAPLEESPHSSAANSEMERLQDTGSPEAKRVQDGAPTALEVQPIDRGGQQGRRSGRDEQRIQPAFDFAAAGVPGMLPDRHPQGTNGRPQGV